MPLREPPLLLIHGGLHGAACWDGTINALARRGRRATAFDLPGQGADPTPRAAIGIGDYVAAAIRRLDELPEPATVVCHSFGGVTATALADARPDRVAALIFVAAVVPGDGGSLDAAADRPSGGRFEEAFTTHEPGVSHAMPPSEAMHFFYHDCPAEIADRALASLCPQSLRPMREPVALVSGRLAEVPMAYLRCLRDRVLPLAVQDANARRYPATQVFDIDSGHSPFLAREAEFVELVLQAEMAVLSHGAA